MSREQYTPPTLSQGGSTTGGAAAAGGASQPTVTYNVTGSNVDDASKPVSYLCAQCDNKVTLKAKDVIRCKDCGGRVLYKERTSRMVQFEAR